MTLQSDVPPVAWTSEGFIAPLESAVLQGTLSDIIRSFGGGLNPALYTVQGQLAMSLAALVGNVNDTFLYYVTQTDPAFAQGRMQDAIGRIYYIYRKPGNYTTANCLCTGAAGVVIPAGAIAVTPSGQKYICQVTTTIPISGSVLIPFSADTIGPIVCPADTINQIFQSIPSWDTINNPTEGSLGSNTESRADFEDRRSLSTALNSNGSLPSIRGAVLAVPGVNDAFVTENDNDTPLTIGGVTLAAHSVYVCVDGGTGVDVATAIWTRKAPGCAYTGTTSVTVYDTSQGYTPPGVPYVVKYTPASDLPVVVQVNLINNPKIPSTADAQIQQAITNIFAGVGASSRPKIGVPFLASTLYPAIVALGSWAQILNIVVGSQNSPVVTFVGHIAGTTLTVDSVSSGTIQIGQRLFSDTNDILSGTVITGGGGSVWTVSKSQTISAETMYGVTANASEVIPNINQVPVNDPVNNIIVNLI